MNIAVFISAFCISVYWATVTIKAIALSRKIGKDPNVIPRERTGRWLRLIWAPTIFIWIILLWNGIFSKNILISPIISIVAGCIVIVATLLTFWCWHQMGKSWRIGIDPREKTQLIISGAYKYVLHPIYSLSMILGIATYLTLPTAVMLVVICIHILMLNLEARREEKYLLSVHGQTYREYQARVGRFFPKLVCPFSKKP